MPAAVLAVALWQVLVDGPLVAADEWLALRLRAGAPPAVLAELLADLGSPAAALPVPAAAAAYAGWRGRRLRPPAAAAGAMAAVPAAVVPLKALTGRPGPFGEAGGWFPSGHATTAAVAFGAAALLLQPHVRAPLRPLLRAAAGLLCAAAGAGLVWCGYHWPLDVLAGWCLGGVLLAAFRIGAAGGTAERVCGDRRPVPTMAPPPTPGGTVSVPGARPEPSPDLSAFVAGLPKAELHVHHIGSASPRIVAELAARHPGSAVPADPDELAKYFVFRDFAHFIEVYLSVVDLVRDAEDVRLLTYEVARDMARQNIRYAELTVTPYSSTRRGIPERAFMEAIEDARKAAEAELGVVLRWCFDIPGEAGPQAAEETARLACDPRLRPEGLVSFGLGGPELGVPRPQFKPYFDRAVAEGLHSVPHAGETTGPQTIRDALTFLRAERIGHGTSAPQDPGLLEHLAEHRIPLEVCPTSNVATRAVPSLEEHPLREMAAAGVLVTVNSDDPPMFGTDLCTEYGIAARLLDLDAAGVAALAKNAVEASFAPEDAKSSLTAEIDAHLASWAPA